MIEPIEITVERYGQHTHFFEEMNEAMEHAGRQMKPGAIGVGWNECARWSAALPADPNNYHWIFPGGGYEQLRKTSVNDWHWAAAIDTAMEDLETYFTGHRIRTERQAVSAFVLRPISCLQLFADDGVFPASATLLIADTVSGHDALEELEAVKRDFAPLFRKADR